MAAAKKSSVLPPVQDPMYTRSIFLSRHSCAVLRLSGEWGAATTGTSFSTSMWYVLRYVASSSA